MPRNTPIHASDKTLNRLAHHQWLHTADKDDDTEDYAMLDTVHDIVDNQLTDIERELLYDRYYDQLPYSRIAQKHGWRNKGTAWFAVRKAVNKLRDKIRSET